MANVAWATSSGWSWRRVSRARLPRKRQHRGYQHTVTHASDDHALFILLRPLRRRDPQPHRHARSGVLDTQTSYARERVYAPPLAPTNAGHHCSLTCHRNVVVCSAVSVVTTQAQQIPSLRRTPDLWARTSVARCPRGLGEGEVALHVGHGDLRGWPGTRRKARACAHPVVA